MNEKIYRAVQNNPRACVYIIGGLILYCAKATIANEKTKRQLKKCCNSLIRCKTKMSMYMNESLNEEKNGND